MFTSTLLLALLPSIVVAAPHQRHAKHYGDMSCMQQQTPSIGKAIYFLTNEAENAVVALPIGSDGMLSKGTIIPTGGAGSNSITATGQPAAPDALVGQSALTIVGTHLFAVNAGSNTLTMLSISAHDPTSLSMLGKPVAVSGEFPNTVAASAKNKLACVGTTGALAGISCATFSKHGLGEMDGLRPFHLGQTTPPTQHPLGPLNTVSQTFFSVDETMLFTTVKGDPTVNKTGFLSVFPVQAGCLSTEETRSSPNGTVVLFGSSTIPNDPSSIFVTDAAFGAAVLTVDSDGNATVKGKQAIEGQNATCWATVSSATNSAFVTDILVNRLVEMSLEDANIIATLDLSANGDSGLTDLVAAGNYVYALSPGNGSTKAAITVLDVSGGQGSMREVQHFELGGLAGKNAQGMAVLL